MAHVPVRPTFAPECTALIFPYRQDIAQCKMVKWAEAMHARGIKVYDVHRTLWRPRLRTRK